jgi:glycosyltransferase involved in cell wall biosynthesis
MKVMFVIGLPCPFPSAAWTRIESFVNALIEKGYQVQVICSEKRGLQSYINGVPLRTQGVFNAFAFFIVTFVKVLRYRPNFVIISVPPGIHAFGASLACFLLKQNVIFDYRDRWEDYLIYKTSNKIKRNLYRILKSLMSFLYSKATLVITVIPPFKEHLSKRGIKNVYLLPNGADTNVFKPLPSKKQLREKHDLEDDSFIMIYSGHIGKYYKLDPIIKALGILSTLKNIDRKVKLVLAGEGEDVEYILKLSKQLNLEKNIKYLGVKYNKKELAEIIALADVGIIPFNKNPLWKEALPAKLFEYCSSGIPVIATVESDSLLASVIDKEKIGFHVEPENIDDLAQVIIQIITDDKFLFDASKRAREFVVREFDRTKIAKKFVKLLEALSSYE